MKETEIEIQAKVEKIAPLLSFLKEKAGFEYETHQRDEYFTPAHRDFLAVRPVQEWLRLRDADAKFSFNYKYWHFDEEQRGLYADEYETKIESLETTKKILESLNFKSVIIVDKFRKAWKYEDYEIAVDSVKDLGDFVEVEYIGKQHHSNHKEIMDGMISFLKKLGCGILEINHSGYPALLLGHQGKVDRI